MPTALGTIASHRTAPATGGLPVAGAVGWYDASQLTGANGSRITTWPDLSGAGRNLTGPGPTLTANGLNGKTTAQFTGGLDNSLSASAAAAFQHFFIVAKYDYGATFLNYDGLLTGMTEPHILIGDSGNTSWYSPPVTAYHMNGTLYTGTLPAPMQSWAVISASGTTWGSFQLMVGMDRGIYGRFWRGPVAEVIAYNRVLSTVERQQVEAYLTAKWIPTYSDVLAEPFNNFTANGWATLNSPTIVAGRTGTAAQTAGALAHADWTIPAINESDVVTVGFAWRPSVVTAVTRRIIGLYSDTNTTEHIRITHNGSTGTVSCARASTTLVTSAAGLIVANTWYYVEVQAKLGDSPNGYVIVRLDGVEIINTGPVDTKNGGTKTTFDTLRIQVIVASNTNQYDDLYLTMGAGAPFKGDHTIP